MSHSSFENKTIDELCQVIDCEHKTAPYVKSSEFLVVRTSNVRNGQLIMEDMKYTTKEGFEEWTQRAIPSKGDVLFTREAPAGESCLVPEDKKVCMGQRMVLLRPDKKKLDSAFLSMILATEKYKFEILKSSIGSTVSRINIGDIKKLNIIYPPIQEQKKIAEILSTWDKAIEKVEKLVANSQQQKKALMQQLLTGEIRFFGKNSQFAIPKGVLQKKLGLLPIDWKVEHIKNHIWFQEGPGVRNSQFKESGIKLFNGTNIQFNRINLQNTNTYISENEGMGAYRHFLVDDGDLLIACSGISVNRFDEKIAFVNESHLPLCMNTSTMRFKQLENGLVNMRYFYYFMQTWLFKNQIRGQATGSAQLNFGPSHIANCFVAFPNIEEQEKIAQVLTLADREIDLYQQQLDKLKLEKKSLMQQLLTGQKRVIID